MLSVTQKPKELGYALCLYINVYLRLKFQVFHSKKVNHYLTLILQKRILLIKRFRMILFYNNLRLIFTQHNPTIKSRVLWIFISFSKMTPASGRKKDRFRLDIFWVNFARKLFRSRSFSLFPLNYNLCIKKSRTRNSW